VVNAPLEIGTGRGGRAVPLSPGQWRGDGGGAAAPQLGAQKSCPPPGNGGPPMLWDRKTVFSKQRGRQTVESEKTPRSGWYVPPQVLTPLYHSTRWGGRKTFKPVGSGGGHRPGGPGRLGGTDLPAIFWWGSDPNEGPRAANGCWASEWGGGDPGGGGGTKHCEGGGGGGGDRPGGPRRLGGVPG